MLSHKNVISLSEQTARAYERRMEARGIPLPERGAFLRWARFYLDFPPGFGNRETKVMPPGSVNLVLIGKFSNGHLGDTMPGTRCSFVATNTSNYPRLDYSDFLISCAHEVGHQFGLSTHNLLDPLHPKHDGGKYPEKECYLDGKPIQTYLPGFVQGAMDSFKYALMSEQAAHGQWRWIRNEDWEKANDMALILQ